MTQLLRAPHSPPLWRDLRRQLQRRGFDAGEALVAESYEDDATNDEVGVVVAAGPRVALFRVHQGAWQWHDLTSNWKQTDFAGQVRVGLEMLCD